MIRISKGRFIAEVEAALLEKERMAKRLKVPFEGLTANDLMAEIDKRVGTSDWRVNNGITPKLGTEDINAVANSRFYRKTGLKLLMAFGIVIMGLALITRTWNILPVYLYYGLNLGAAVIFVYVYGKKQRETRKELWQGIDGEDTK